MTDKQGREKLQGFKPGSEYATYAGVERSGLLKKRKN